MHSRNTLHHEPIRMKPILFGYKKMTIASCFAYVPSDRLVIIQNLSYVFIQVINNVLFLDSFSFSNPRKGINLSGD